MKGIANAHLPAGIGQGQGCQGSGGAGSVHQGPEGEFSAGHGGGWRHKKTAAWVPRAEYRGG